MKIIHKIALPLISSAIGAVIGNRIIKTRSPFVANDALAIGAGTLIPLVLRFTGLPAAGLGCVLSVLMSKLLSDDTQPTEVNKPVKKSQSKTNTNNDVAETQKKRVIDDFNNLFNIQKKHEQNIDKIQAERQSTAFNSFNDYMRMANPQQKIEITETIFTNFKNKNDNNFNSSEIWTDLLKTLSEQKDIDDNTNISLAVADGNEDTKLNVTFGQLKEFMTHLTNNMCQDLSNFNDKNIQSSVNNFVDNLKINKPCFKIINHGNAHYTALVMQKTKENEYHISHINSGKYKTVNFDTGAIKQYLKTFIGEKNTTKYQNFFSDKIAFKIPSHGITGLNDNHSFTPYTQDTNACHHISVMNLLKFFIEKCPAP